MWNFKFLFHFWTRKITFLKGLVAPSNVNQFRLYFITPNLKGLDLYGQYETFIFLSYFWTRKILKIKLKLYLNFEILGLLFFFRFFNGLAAHLNMNQFRRNFTESIFLWNGTFHITEQHIFFAQMAKNNVFQYF